MFGLDWLVSVPELCYRKYSLLKKKSITTFRKKTQNCYYVNHFINHYEGLIGNSDLDLTT